METPSFFSRATGTLVNPLSKAVDSVREVIAHHAGDPDEKLLLQNMLQLFVVVLRADGDVSATEQQAVATLVRDVYGETAAAQLQQMLAEDKAPDLAEVCAGLASLTAEEKEILLRALFAAAFADNQYAKAEEDCMHRIARELHPGVIADRVGALGQTLPLGLGRRRAEREIHLAKRGFQLGGDRRQ